MRGVVCLALAGVCLLAAAEKVLKPGESEVYNDVIKDLTASNLPKALSDLDAWAQKYPDSDYRDDRTALYVQTYVLSNQFAKALDAASELISKNLEATATIRLLYNVVGAILQTSNPTPAEIATAQKAAHLLMDYDRPLPGVAADKWAEARTDMKARAGAALLYLSVLPGIQAMAKTPPDCAGAEGVYRRAVSDYPDRAGLSYELGRVLNCEAKTNPEKQAGAIYEFVRAATIDPTLGDPRTDKKKIQTFADNAYIKIHGSDEGLEQLRQQVRRTPLPPADFAIKTATEIAAEKDDQWDKEHPQLTLWKKIKAILTAEGGEAYYESQMKDAAVPPLTGTLLEARPACRPRELLVTIPLPDASRQAEITLKLDKPLAGKPDPGQEFQFEGVPSAFNKVPFMLTMDADVAKLQGLKTAQCAPVRKK